MNTKNNQNNSKGESLSTPVTTTYIRNGKEYVRVKHSSIHRSTANQKANRQKFGARQAVLTKFSIAYKIGFDQMRQPGHSGYIEGVTFNTLHAMANGVVDMMQLQLSQGKLPGVCLKNCSLNGQGLHVEWESEIPCDATNENDETYICVAMESMEQRPILFGNSLMLRKTGVLDHQLEPKWKGKTIYVYAFTRRKESNTCSRTTVVKVD